MCVYISISIYICTHYNTQSIISTSFVSSSFTFDRLMLFFSFVSFPPFSFFFLNIIFLQKHRQQLSVMRTTRKPRATRAQDGTETHTHTHTHRERDEYKYTGEEVIMCEYCLLTWDFMKLMQELASDAMSQTLCGRSLRMNSRGSRYL